MPKVNQAYLKIADKLAEAKNYLYEVVQKKIEEGKDQTTIIKEIKKEFSPNESVICDIENTFFKTAYIGSGINELYEEGEISDDIYTTIGKKYREMESQIAPLFGKGKYQNQEEFERAFAKWVRAAYPNIYDRVASKENIDFSDIPEIDFSKVSYIKKLKDKEKWRVYSESGKNMGTYDSMKDAKNRLKEIETFKHIKKSNNNPYLQKQAATLVGKEIQLKNDTVIKFNEFNVAIPTTAFGIITKENPIIAQFDIDDIHMFKAPNGKLYYTKEEVEEEFQKQYGHYWEMEVNLSEINITGAESNIEAISRKVASTFIWDGKILLNEEGDSVEPNTIQDGDSVRLIGPEAHLNIYDVLPKEKMLLHKAESWLDQAKPGDKVQLDGGETGEVLNVSEEKVEVKTPTKTETVWKTKTSFDKHTAIKDQILNLLNTVFGGSWDNVIKAIEEYKPKNKTSGIFDRAKVWLMITLIAGLLGVSAQDILAASSQDIKERVIKIMRGVYHPPEVIKDIFGIRKDSNFGQLPDSDISDEIGRVDTSYFSEENKVRLVFIFWKISEKDATSIFKDVLNDKISRLSIQFKNATPIIEGFKKIEDGKYEAYVVFKNK